MDKNHTRLSIWIVCATSFIVILMTSLVYLLPYIYLHSKELASDYDHVLYIYDLGRIDRLTTHDVYPISVEWAPDRKSIALRYNDGWDFDDPIQFIGVLDIASHHLSQILRIDKGANVQYVDGITWQGINMAWSPYEKKILFNMLSDEDYQQLYLLDVQTKILSATQLEFRDTGERKNINVVGITWSPGPFAIVNLCFDNKDDLEQCQVFSIDDGFSSISPVFTDRAMWVSWLSDGETIVYSCYEDYENEIVKYSFTPAPKGICSYSFQTHLTKLLTTELKIPNWSSDGLLAFEWWGGGEGDRRYLMVYNTLLDKSYRLPRWFINEYRWLP